MSHTPERRAAIRGAIEGLAAEDFASAGRALLDALGYRSPKTLDAPSEPSKFLAALEMDPVRFEGLDRWRAVHFLLQLTGDELPALSRGGDPATGEAFQRGAIDSFVFLALDLDDEPWSRRQLVAIVRAFNRGFAMPAILLFRHGGSATLAVIDRRANLRDPSRDVVGGRISLVKDIDLASPHRAHVEILAEGPDHLALKELVRTNPHLVGLAIGDGAGEAEYCLPSGDSVDVVFRQKRRVHAVEVKPASAAEADIARGLFQCVKYRAVLEALAGYEHDRRKITVCLALGATLPVRLIPLRNSLNIDVFESLAP